MTTGQPEPQMIEIQRWEDVPPFATEREEAAYWETHALGDAILATMADAPDDPRLPAPRGRADRRAQMISIRLDPGDLELLKTIAAQRTTRYQSLLKQWLSERLAVEAAEPTGLGRREERATSSFAQQATRLAGKVGAAMPRPPQRKNVPQGSHSLGAARSSTERTTRDTTTVTPPPTPARPKRQRD